MNKKALEYAEQSGEQPTIADILNHIALNQMNLVEFDKAQENLDKSLDIDLKTNYVFGLSSTYSIMGRNYFKQNKTTQAIAFGEKALDIAKNMGLKSNISSISGALHEYYKSAGQPAKALDMYEQSVSLRDSLQSEENQRALIKNEYAYVYEKEALADSLSHLQEVTVLNAKNERQKNLLWSFGIGAGIFSLLSFFIWNLNQKLRTKNGIVKKH